MEAYTIVNHGVPTFNFVFVGDGVFEKKNTKQNPSADNEASGEIAIGGARIPRFAPLQGAPPGDSRETASSSSVPSSPSRRSCRSTSRRSVSVEFTVQCHVGPVG